MPRTWLVRFAWMAAGIAFLYGVSALAGVVSGGPLDPPYPPTAGTMKTIDSIAPSWFQILPSDDGAPCLNSRFYCVMNDDAVLDRETGLVWQRSPATGTFQWIPGIDSCLDATTGGRRGWRLPSPFELTSLLRTDNAFVPLPPDGHPFTNIPLESSGQNFSAWSSETVPDNATLAWTVRIGDNVFADVEASTKSGTHRAWCVRGAGEGDR